MQYCQEIRKYTHLGDLNINFDNLEKGDTHSHKSDLWDTFSLFNLVNGVTCVKSQNDTSIDVMLTNRPKSFYNTNLIATGLSDCHKVIVYRKSQNIEIIKHLIEMNSYEISIKNWSKVIHTMTSNNMTYLHQFFEGYQTSMLF